MTLWRKFGNPSFEPDRSGCLGSLCLIPRLIHSGWSLRDGLRAQAENDDPALVSVPISGTSGLWSREIIMSAHGQLSQIPISKFEGRLTVGGVSLLLTYLTGFVVYMTWPGNYCPSSGFLSDLFFPLMWLLSPIIPCC